MPPPCEEAEEPGVKGPPSEDGGVSTRWSPYPVSTEQGVVLPGLRGAAAGAIIWSVESLRRISDDVSGWAGAGAGG